MKKNSIIHKFIILSILAVVSITMLFSCSKKNENTSDGTGTNNINEPANNNKTSNNQNKNNDNKNIPPEKIEMSIEDTIREVLLNDDLDIDMLDSVSTNFREAYKAGKIKKD